MLQVIIVKLTAGLRNIPPVFIHCVTLRASVGPHRIRWIVPRINRRNGTYWSLGLNISSMYKYCPSGANVVISSTVLNCSKSVALVTFHKITKINEPHTRVNSLLVGIVQCRHRLAPARGEGVPPEMSDHNQS